MSRVPETRPFTPSVIARLNDSLRSCGFASLPLTADMSDTVNASVTAISTLLHRLAESQRHEQPVIPRQRTPSVERVVIHPNPALPTGIPIGEHKAVVDENRNMQKSLNQLNSKLTSLNHTIRLKETELERLQSLITDKMKEDDKRAALAMTTIRDQKMPHSSLVVLNNLQKQLSNVETDNAALVRKNSNLTTRIRILEEERQRLSSLVELRTPSPETDHNHEIANLENELKRALEELDSLRFESAHKDTLLSKANSKYYEIVEERNFEKKRQLSGKLGRVDPARRDKLLDDISNIVKSDDPVVLFDIIKKYGEIAQAKFPPLESFVAELRKSLNISESNGMGELDVMRNRVEELCHASAVLERIKSLLGASREDMLMDSLKALIEVSKDPLTIDADEFGRLRSMKTTIASILGIQQSKGDLVSAITQSVQRLEFKTNEFNNFFKQLCLVLDLPVTNSYIPSYNKCMEKVRELNAVTRKEILGHTFGSAKFVENQSDSDASPINTMNLAFSREIVRIPKNR